MEPDEKPLRAEELIAEVYRQVLEFREAGRKPARVVMDRPSWQVIEDYHRRLGPLEGSMADYLSEEGLFGLEIWYGDNPDVRVE